MHIAFTIFGYLSTVMGLITQIPQVITVFKHRSAKNISYPYISFILIDCIFYVIYGTGFLLSNNYDGIPIVITGVIPFIITCILIFLKILFKIFKRKKIKDTHDSVSVQVDNIIPPTKD